MNYFKHPYIKFSIKLLFTTAILAVVFMNVPFSLVVSTLLGSHIGWLSLAVLFFMLSKYFSSIRLNHFFTNTNMIVGSIYNIKLYLLGMFYNFFLPTGVGGDAYKVIKIHNDYSYPVKNIASTVFFDRISGLVALINIALIFSLYFTNAIQATALILILVAGNGVYHVVVRKFISIHFISIKTEILSLLVQLSQCVCAYCILKAIAIENNELIYIIVFLISSVASLFPLSIGGLGAREYTFMIAATYFNLNTEKAIAIGFLFYIISLFVSLFGSYYIFKPIHPVKTHA